MKIGIFDSGSGGLTVLKELINDYPNNEYIYFGDTLNLPYGTKSKDELEIRADLIIDFFKKQKVNMVVIACGTISSNIYSKIKDKYGMTLIDVLTPTIKYITDNKLTDIGVLGTPMTIQSGYFSEIAKSEVACPLLVPLIENGKKDTKECEEIVIDYLKRLHNPKNIILGCTHYPILSDIIKKHSKAKLINMGKCVSQYLNLTNIGIPKVTLYFSKIDETLKDNVYSILKQNYEIQEKII